MKKIICVFVDSLLVESYDLSVLHQEHIAELKDYLDPVDELFIYTTDFPLEHEQFLARVEEILKLIPKNLRGIITINSFDKFDKLGKLAELIELGKLDQAVLADHNSYLKNKAESGDIVIIVGEFLEEQLLAPKFFNFTLVNWPYRSIKTLAQLCSEQIKLDSERSATPADIKPSLLRPKQIEKRDVVLCDCQLLQVQMLQLEASQLRLITSIRTFEKEMIQSERTQIHLLEDSAKNFPLHIVETVATLALLAWHFVPYIYKKICKIINYCNGGSKNDGPKMAKSKKTKSKKVKSKAVANVTVTEPKVINFDRQIADSFPYSSIDIESLAVNDAKSIGLKNFAKSKNYNVSCLRKLGSFFNKNDNSDIHMPLLNSDECSKPKASKFELV